MIPSVMRRFLIVLGFLALGFGAFAAWWIFFWVNPQEVLSQSLQNLASAKTAQSFRASVSWDLRSPSGGAVFQKWLSCSVALDASDPTKPKAAGLIGYTEDPSGQDFHTADAVLAADRVYVRLHEDAGADLLGWFSDAGQRASGRADERTDSGSQPSALSPQPISTTSTSATSTEPAWFSFDRAALLTKAGIGSWTAAGSGADVHTALINAGVGSWVVAGPSKTYVSGNARLMDVQLRLNENAIATGLSTLIQPWRKRSATGAEFAWASLAAADASKGTWTATIDVRTRRFREIQGTFPMLSGDGIETGRATVDFIFDGWNAPVSIKPPSSSIDLTSAIVEKAPSTFSPSKTRPTTMPQGSPATSTGTPGM